MLLATIDGLLNSNPSHIDYQKIMANFLNLLQYGEFTPFSHVFVVGISTNSALTIYKQHINNHHPEDIMCSTGKINSNENGSLMRILPISLYLHYLNIDYLDSKFIEIIKTIYSMTHSHIYSIL